MTYKPVDTAIVMVVGPCIDDTDFKTLEEAIAYDAAGMDVSLIVEKTDGTTAVTAITLTTAGTSDWTHKDGGYYEIEITAAQNAEEGIAYVRGVCTGVLPFESIHYNVVKANVYDSWIKGTDVIQTDVTQWLGTAAATPTVAGVPEVDVTHWIGTAAATPTTAGVPEVDVTHWLGTAVTANVAGQPTVDVTRLGAQTAPLIDLIDFASNGYDSTNNVVFSDLVYIHGSALTETAGQLAAGFTKLFDVATPLLVASDVMRGTDSAALAATALTDATWTDAKAAFIDHSIATVDTNLDTLLTRITAARAGYLDNLSAGAVALAATALTDVTWTDAKAAFLDHSIATVDTNVDTLLTRITAAVALASALATAQTDLDKITGTDGATLATAQALYAPNKVVPDVAGTATTLHGVTDGKVDAVQTDATAIKAKTDNLPSGIAKNVALSNFQAYMVLSSDHVTAATGKTLTGTISKAGGAFASLTNAITEIANGLYKVNITQTEMNADVITLKFTETDCDQRVVVIHTT